MNLIIRCLLFGLFFIALTSNAQVNAPITMLGKVTNAIPGTVAVPVMVQNCYQVGAISLTFQYDNSVLSYLDFSANAAFNASGTDLFVDGTTSGTVVISWTDWSNNNPVSLANGSTMVNINFTYKKTIADYSALTFDITTTGACE